MNGQRGCYSVNSDELLTMRPVIILRGVSLPPGVVICSGVDNREVLNR